MCVSVARKACARERESRGSSKEAEAEAEGEGEGEERVRQQNKPRAVVGTKKEHTEGKPHSAGRVTTNHPTRRCMPAAAPTDG